jgi:glucose-6-phosphate 1-dehydrogenase
MEPPAVFNANALRDEKVKVLRAVRPIEESVRGQYEGYADEEDVAQHSDTATFAALELYVDNWRWQDVPFFLRSGKRMATKATEIIVRFHHVPHLMFPLPPGEEITANFLSICIQPDEGINLRFETKQPGAGMRTRSVEMEYDYATHYGDDALPDAYERLLLDAMQGDASLFARADEIELAWQLIDPVLETWDRPQGPALRIYEPGSWGPGAAEGLLEESGRHWIHCCEDSEEE